MGKLNRIGIYFLGFGLGTALVTMMMLRREAREAQAVDPWVVREERARAEGFEPLPERLPEQLREGRVMLYGLLPDAEAPSERIWLVYFEESYPYVRIVEDLGSGELSFMAADQVVIELKPGVDVTALKPMLDELDLRLRMFNRKENLAVVGVVSREIDGVPATLRALEPWSQLFAEAHPDWILLR